MVCFIYTWKLLKLKTILKNEKGIRMFPVCYSYALVLLLSSVRYLYVTRMRIRVYPIRMLLVSIRMLLVCYSYVFVCIRMLLVCCSFSYVSVWCFSPEIVTLLTTLYYLLSNERRDRAHKKFLKKAQNSVKKAVYFLHDGQK